MSYVGCNDLNVPPPERGLVSCTVSPDLETFDGYQKQVKTFAAYHPNQWEGNLDAIKYVALGLAGEAGEVANKVKKLARDGDTPEARQQIVLELGDTLWYISAFASELGIDLSAVADANIAKLKSRRARGTLHGSGDNR